MASLCRILGSCFGSSMQSRGSSSKSLLSQQSQKGSAGQSPGHADRAKTVVHLVRHGENENFDKFFPGRLPGHHLSVRGQQMADRVAKALASRDVEAVITSPLERAQETAAPIAAMHGLQVRTDERLIEPVFFFEGQPRGIKNILRNPRNIWHLRNPFRPSWTRETFADVLRSGRHPTPGRRSRGSVGVAWDAGEDHPARSRAPRTMERAPKRVLVGVRDFARVRGRLRHED